MPLNRAAFNKKLAKSVPFLDRVAGANRRRFEFLKRKLLSDFDSHPVTKELEGGPQASNLSGTLGGQGNLFSFIGFPASSKPTEIVRNILEEGVLLIPRDTTSSIASVRFRYTILLPRERLESETPMPFETGNSWLFGIERGISGFSHYVYTNKDILASRSGKGIQASAPIRGATFNPTPYVGAMLQKFLLQVNDTSIRP